MVCAGAGLVSYLFNYGSTSACNCRTALKAMRARSSSPCLTCENSGRGAMPCCSSSYFRFIWPRGPMDEASAAEPGIAGSSPAGVIAADPIQTAQRFCPRPCGPSSLWLSPSTTMFGFCRAYQANTLMPCRTVSAGQLAWTLCPSGLRGWTQVPLAQAVWVQIPQVSFMILEWMDEWRRTWTPHFFIPSFLSCFPFLFNVIIYVFRSLSLALSLSLFLSCSLSLSLTISLSFSCSCAPLLSPRPRVSFTRMLGSRRAARCMSSERHTRPPLQFKKRFNHDVELLAS